MLGALYAICAPQTSRNAFDVEVGFLTKFEVQHVGTYVDVVFSGKLGAAVSPTTRPILAVDSLCWFSHIARPVRCLLSAYAVSSPLFCPFDHILIEFWHPSNRYDR